MIKNKTELKEYLDKDVLNYQAVSGKLGLKSKLLNKLLSTPISDQSKIWSYIKTLRFCEYYQYTKNNSLGWAKLYKTINYIYYLFKLRKLSRVTGFQIPPNTIGKGLTIYHWGPLIVNGFTKVGDYCTIRPDVVIGYKDKSGPAPIIGNNVVINSGCRIIGNGIIIGDNVIIAPGAVVTKSIPSDCIVAGVPAQIIKKIPTAQ